MEPINYRCLLPPSSTTALETVSIGPWNSVEFEEPVIPGGPMAVQTSGMRIRGNAEIEGGVMIVDIVPKLEVFRLHAELSRTSEEIDPRFKPASFRSSGELLSAFLGNSHQMFVAARQHRVPEWASGNVAEIVVEDLLLIRDVSGQRAFVSPADQPGLLLVTRNESDVIGSDVSIRYLRPI